MFTVLLVPNFRLGAALWTQPGRHLEPVALIDATEARLQELTAKERGKAPILQLTPVAYEATVTPGMTATQAQARCSRLRLVYRDLVQEERCRDRLLDLAADLGSDYEATADGHCTLDLFGNRRVREMGIEAAAEESVTRLLAAGFHDARVGVADNPDLALLAAHCADPIRIVRPNAENDTHAFLHPLPVAALRPTDEMADILASWGIRTIGDFVRLPREQVIERLGAEAQKLAELARGGHRRLLKLVRMPTDFTGRHEFEHEVDSLEPLLFLARRMLETITARLEAACLSAGELVVQLEFAAGNMYTRTLRLPEPSCEIERLFRNLHAHLEDFKAKAPIRVLTLEARPVRATRQQQKLFESTLRDPHRFAETLGRLEAMLGPDRIGTPAIALSHRPDAFALHPFSIQETAADYRTRAAPLLVARHRPRQSDALTHTDALRHENQAGQTQFGLPLRRFRPPLSADVRLDPRTHHPVFLTSGRRFTGAVRQSRGPFTLSGDWWDTGRWHRQEWDLELDNGILLRVVKVKSRHWQVDGTYD